MSGEKYRFRRGSVTSGIPLVERLGISEPIHDPDTGSLGIGCGEQNPRWYPGLDNEGNLILQEGQQIVSNDNPNTKIGFVNGFFIVTVDGKEVLKVSKDADAIIDSLTLSDSLKFDQLTTVDFPETPGFAFKDGKFVISCPLEILGSLNLSLSEFAAGIIPDNANPGDVFTAGDFPGDPYHWASPDLLVNKLTKLAPLLYRVSTKNSRTLDMTFGPYPTFFGMNSDRLGAFNDDLIRFLSTFNGGFSRNTGAFAYDTNGKLVAYDVNQPRLDFDPLTGRFLGVLIEDASTNLHTSSNSLAAYNNNNMSASVITSPNWNALNLRSPSSLSEIGSGEHYVQRSFNSRPLNTPHSYSVHVELPSDNATVKLLLSLSANGNTFGAKFSLNKMSASSTSNVIAGNGVLYSTTVRQLSPTIFRIGISGVLDAGNANVYTLNTRIQGLDAASNTSYTSTASGTAYVGEIQLEPIKRVTSFMPTTSVIFARDADNMALTFDNTFNFTAFKNFLGIKFISNQYVEGDPIFSLFNPAYKATLEAGPNNTIRITKGTVDSSTTSNIGTIDNDFVTYEFDCTGQPLNSTLNVGASSDFTKRFNGWVNLIYLYR